MADCEKTHRCTRSYWHHAAVPLKKPCKIKVAMVTNLSSHILHAYDQALCQITYTISDDFI